MKRVVPFFENVKSSKGFYDSLFQVIKWIDEHGEPFLDKHTDVGMTAEKAEALLKRHEEFEAIAKVSDSNEVMAGKDWD